MPEAATEGNANSSIKTWMLICAPLVLFLSLAFIFYDCTVDDAFISFRCARNLAQGHGLVFNIGDRVEAFSNPLWVLILSLAHMAGLDILTVSKLIGLGCGVITILLIMRLCRRSFSMSNGATLAAMCYAATNVSIVFYSVSGMETVVYMMVIVLMNCLILDGREILAGIACGALAVTRPEGIVFVIPLVLGCCLNRCRPGRILGAALIPVVTYGLFLLFRLGYYGGFFPNSYDAKIGGITFSVDSMLYRAQALKRYTWNSSSIQAPVLFLSLAGIVVLFSRRSVPLIASVAAASFFVWLSKGDWMSFWRFYTPVIPFIVLFWAGTFEHIRPSLMRSKKGKLVLLIFLLPVLINFASTVKTRARLESGEEFNPAMHSKAHVSIGRYISEMSAPSDVIVVNEIGAIGYYSDLTLIDMLGLTDSRVPELLRRGDLDDYADYVLGRDPRFIMLNDRQLPGDTGLHPVHAAIYDKMEETGLYRKERVFRLNDFKNLMLFVKED